MSFPPFPSRTPRSPVGVGANLVKVWAVIGGRRTHLTTVPLSERDGVFNRVLETMPQVEALYSTGADWQRVDREKPKLARVFPHRRPPFVPGGACA